MPPSLLASRREQSLRPYFNPLDLYIGLLSTQYSAGAKCPATANSTPEQTLVSFCHITDES